MRVTWEPEGRAVKPFYLQAPSKGVQLEGEGREVNHDRKSGLSVIVLFGAGPASLAQNTGNLMLRGNTTNPVLSGNSTVLPARSELTVSPALPSSGLLTNASTGTNQLTGMPCSGPGSLSVSGVGGLPGATAPPTNGDSATPQLPAFPSVFGSANTTGAC